MSVRALAAEVLRKAERGFVDEVLGEARTEKLSARDRALLTELVYGVTRRRLTLDYILDQLAKGKKVPLKIRIPLRLALYQIRYMRVPAYAAVNEAVGQCRRVSAKSGGFANAVLRRAADAPPPFPEDPPARRLSVEHSHPEWLVARWLKLHGEEKTAELCAAGNVSLPVTARVRGSDEVVVVEGNPADYPRPIQVQDRTQMRAAPLLAPRPGERVLDLCAAPGGKTIHMADLMENRGEIVAVDVSAERLKLVEDARVPIVRCVVCDGREFSESGFDAVLVDAPCSNT
ncbi:MAG: transcription antitermination factor NusB, partial [Planctomycetota bacterium]